MSTSLDIAIIGMSCRLPQAANHQAYWRNLLDGRESISFLDEDELEKDFHLVRNPVYVKATGYLEDHDTFDAEFFGISSRQAQLMTPEHRVTLESAWAAFEDAGYNPSACAGEVGVYGACNPESIARYKLPPDWISTAKEVIEGSYGWCPDSIAPNILYHLGLKGEAVSLATLCTGFHTAVHLACQSLLLGQTDLALACGVVVRVPQKRGYLWEDGGAFSRDGHCRPFDAAGTGAPFGSGVVSVVLKPMARALEDRDHVYAVIKGTAINNNGRTALKYGMAQPDRLAACIANALACGDVAADSVTLVEAFGIGLAMADAVEVDAMTRAFQTRKKAYCALGSVKGNIGNCGVAAGGAGVVKAALSLYHREIPPSINCRTPNAAVDFANSPFYVHRERASWQPAAEVRRAGITALAGGGYNAHMILEEAPRPASRERVAQPHLVTLSARSAAALARMRHDMAVHLSQCAEVALGDVAFTLNTGRMAFNHRWAAVVGDVRELVAALQGALFGSFAGEMPSCEARTGIDTAVLVRRGARVAIPASLHDRASLSTLARAWVDGHEVDWAHHYSGTAWRRMPLPTYPFARERFWLPSGHAY